MSGDDLMIPPAGADSPRFWFAYRCTGCIIRTAFSEPLVQPVKCAICGGRLIDPTLVDVYAGVQSR